MKVIVCDMENLGVTLGELRNEHNKLFIFDDVSSIETYNMTDSVIKWRTFIGYR